MATLVVARNAGCRLGNRLEQATHLFGLQSLTGIGLAVPVLARHRDSIQGLKGNLFCRYPFTGRQAPGAAIRLASAFLFGLARLRVRARLLGIAQLECDNDVDFDLLDPGFLQQAKANRWTFLRRGWKYRCWRGIEAGLPAMRRFFAPAGPLAEAVSRISDESRAASRVLVGVHVRQTDFLTHRGGQYFFPIEEYTRVMRELAAQMGPGVRFLICSDVDHRRSDFSLLDVSFSSGELLEDLYALAACDFIVGPAISSYSGWAALFGDRPFLGLHGPEQRIAPEAFGPSPLLRRGASGKEGEPA